MDIGNNSGIDALQTLYSGCTLSKEADIMDPAIIFSREDFRNDIERRRRQLETMFMKTSDFTEQCKLAYEFGACQRV